MSSQAISSTSFSTEIAEVEVLQLQSSMGELPQLVADKDYFIFGKDLSIVLPLEATAKMSDLLVCLKVKDIQGKYVTYSNFEQYSNVPDMVFLYYTLNAVTPELVDFGANTITSSTKSLELMFTTPIAEVETVVLQSTMGEFPPMVEGEDYSVYDNMLTLNLPEEYLSKVNNLTVVLKVKDVQGKYVTYSNHSVYPNQEGMIFLELFLTFFKIGAFTFGGGYAMLPILQREVVDNKGWATEEELMDYFAIGQCTPGVIAVNTATFIGQKYKGIAGGIFATLGVVFPSLIIISLLAGVIEAFSHIEMVQHAFGGIRVCVCILILNAVMKLYKKAVVDKATFAIFLLVALGSYFLPISPVVFVIVTAIAGIVLKSMGGKK